MTGRSGFEPAPRIKVGITSLNGQAMVEILSDSGADISVAGKSDVHHFSEHPNNMFPLTVMPWAVNGAVML